MKAILIAYDQAHYDSIIDVLTRTGCRGFTAVDTVRGRGSATGDPHYGSHAWPSLAGAIITVVEDEKADPLLDRLHALDQDKPLLGLRAFVWNIEKSI